MGFRREARIVSHSGVARSSSYESAFTGACVPWFSPKNSPSATHCPCTEALPMCFLGPTFILTISGTRSTSSMADSYL